MTTPSKALPFHVFFRTREGERELTGFTEHLENLEEDQFSPAAAFAENQDIDLRFEGPGDFRLTMDGLDVVDIPGSEKEGDGQFLLPLDRYVTLFQAKNFPLVPGYYVVTVTGGGKNWRSVVEILPKYLQKQQWQDMRDELTSEIRRLSFDFMRRTTHWDLPAEEMSGVDTGMLLRFYIIDDMAGQVMNVLAELARSANSRIMLRTRRVPKEKDRGDLRHERPQDERSGMAAPYRYSRTMETTWDVEENRFAKAVLLRLEESLRGFIRAVADSRAHLRQEQEEARPYWKNYQYQMRREALARFDEYQRRAQKIRSAIRLAEEAPWFEEARAAQPLMPDMAALRDPRYAVLYRLRQRLDHPEESLAVSSFYRFQWKRTDKLYELWCFLTFIKALGAGGWRMESGPALRASGSRYILESLDPGTVIRMKKGDDEIHLVYDAVIPDTAADTDRDHAPLYTNNPHRRPDMRIDCYSRDGYCGSLVADFKYRDIYKLWNDGNSGSEIRLQFNAYRDMNTKFYRHMDEKESLRNSRPVKEVWAVFPRETPALSDEDYSLRFISLAPGLPSNEKLTKLLEEYFHNLGLGSK